MNYETVVIGVQKLISNDTHGCLKSCKRISFIFAVPEFVFFLRRT